MRIAVDIDSTLHHYWDVLSDTARRRFGIDLPYEAQFDWGRTRLRPEQFEICIDETHTDEVILAGRAYPNAVETVNRWAGDGHFVHITSHRRGDCHGATEQWLKQIGLRFDELYCSMDKLSRCEEIGIDVLIDDSPANLLRAVESGIIAATITHPWNEDIRREEDIIEGRDWLELAAKLDPILAPSGAQAGAATSDPTALRHS